MSRIIVCGVDQMPRAVAELQPAYIVSLLPPLQQPPTPSGIDAGCHYRVEIDDVTEPLEGVIMPLHSHVEGFIRFIRGCEPDRGILIHCAAGISRSPAAALIALALESPGREREAGATLRRLAPHVRPNRLLLALADDALDRKGALFAAGCWDPLDQWDEVHRFELPRRLPALAVAHSPSWARRDEGS